MESRASAAAPYSIQKPEWLVFLLTLCAVAEGDIEIVARVEQTCVLAVLSDPRRRIAVLGGREGMRRSLGSVYGGSVTRFLGGFRGGVSRAIAIPRTAPYCNGLAVSRDGSELLISDTHGINVIYILCAHSGALLRTIGGYGNGPLKFSYPCQVSVACDGFVFVADCGNSRIQILTLGYDFHSFVGVGQLHRPAGVCANDDVIVASEAAEHRLSVFDRKDGALLRRFGSYGTGDGELVCPRTLCFMSGQHYVTVAEDNIRRVGVWTFEGEFVRNVRVGKLDMPVGIACSRADELVVADSRNDRIMAFNSSGEVVWESEAGEFTGVTLHGSTIFGQTRDGKCIVFT